MGHTTARHAADVLLAGVLDDRASMAWGAPGTGAPRPRPSVACGMATRTFGTGRRRIGVLGWMLRGAAAGAAGTTALNAVTYLDIAIRGRPLSSTPGQSVEKLAELAHVTIPGDAQRRQNRLQGLGPLSGLAAGIGVGVLAGL